MARARTVIRRERGRGVPALGVLIMILGLLALAGGPGAVRDAGAQVAIQPDHVAFALEGCRNNGGITLPNGSGDFICPDAAYVSGYVGKCR